MMTDNLISSIPYFAKLDPATLEEIRKAATRHKFSAEEIIFNEDDQGTGLWIIEKGWIKVVKYSLSGREQVLHYLGPGEALNLIGVFTNKPNPASVITLEPAVLYHIPRQVMLDLIDQRPDLARQVIADLAERVTHLVSMVEDLSLRSVEARLARYILGHRETGPISRQRWATQSEIAARVGTVPDVLNRVLRKFCEEGLIELSRQEIKILDRTRLEEKIQQD